MKRVTSLGGIFFKCNDKEKMNRWYTKHLGLNTGEYGISFEWRSAETPENKGYTVWSPFANDTKYFEPSQKDFMLNFRVENIESLVEELKKEGVNVVDEIEKLEYGKFVHIMDIEGNKIELWEPNDTEYEKIAGEITK